MWLIIPKNAGSSSKELLYKMSHPERKNSSPTYKELSDLKRKSRFPREMQNHFETSADWTRTAILRDPKERLLSAYLDKVHSSSPSKGNYFKSNCCPMIMKNKSMTAEECYKQESKISFTTFVNAIKTCANIHWYPQRALIDDWDMIDFPINFNNLANDAEHMMKHVIDDAWNKFGKTGWGENGTKAIFEENTRHSTQAKNKYKEYYTPQLEKIVEEMYHADYVLLKKLFPNDRQYQKVQT